MDFQEKVRRLTIKAMFSIDSLLNRIVLKGGNALDIIYNVNGRASLDLDFSLKNDFEEEELPIIEKKINRSLEKAFDPENLMVFDIKLVKRPEKIDPGLKDFWGGYKIQFKVADKEKYKKTVIICRN